MRRAPARSVGDVRIGNVGPLSFEETSICREPAVHDVEWGSARNIHTFFSSVVVGIVVRSLSAEPDTGTPVLLPLLPQDERAHLHTKFSGAEQRCRWLEERYREDKTRLQEGISSYR